MISWPIAALAGIVISFAIVWLTLALAFLLLRPDRAAVREAVRLPADVLRLVRRMLADRDLPRGVRVRLWILLGYLLMPFDIVPDFIPVIGYADDVVVTSILLRGAIRVAGFAAVQRDWTGSPAGLDVIAKLCGHVIEPSDPETRL